MAVLLTAGVSHAGVWGGFQTDTSSNMLMRPGGKSGIYATMYAGMGANVGFMAVSYRFGAGIIEHYEGVQMQTHTVDIRRDIVLSGKSLLSLDGDCTVSRFGSVTYLDGYTELSGSALYKTYPLPNILVRINGEVSGKSYRSFESEDYSQSDLFVRIDRFFPTGTTVRGQVDLGMRNYVKLPGNSSVELAGYRIRAAQSLGGRWGVWIEWADRDVSSDVNNTIADSYDRLFLDDVYMYGSKRFDAGIKRILPGGFLELSVEHVEKAYNSSLASTYWYLPPGGWDETERGITLELQYRPDYLAPTVHPFVELYSFDVDASFGDLSYSSTGLSAGFRVY